MSEDHISRRGLLLAPAALSYSRVLGANDRIRVGVIGCGGRGRYVMQRFEKNPAVEISAVCDVWGSRVDQARELAPHARGFAEHERLLELKELDAVLIATPDHWHVPIAIDAMNAGKDVYVEKPLTLTIDEGPKVIKAVDINRRVCQVGTQRRSSQAFQRVKREYFDSGRLGKMTMMRCWWHNNPVHVMSAPPELKQKPANLNWTRYLGRARWRDWDPQQYWVFRAYLDFGGGMITDLFSHWTDMVHYLLGMQSPLAAVAAGGVYCFKDGRTAPDTVTTVLEYPGDFTAGFEGTLARGYTGSGGEFLGDNGRLLFNRGDYQFQSKEKGSQPVVIQEDEDVVLNHVNNFLDCVRSRKRPNADVLAGHRAAVAAHLGNIAYVQKRRVRFHADVEEVL